MILFMLYVPEHEILIFINYKMQKNEAIFMLRTADYVICPDHKFVGILKFVLTIICWHFKICPCHKFVGILKFVLTINLLAF